MTIVCCVCKRVLVLAGPVSPVSHTVGTCCWDAYRAQLGLKPRAYPAQAAA